MPGPTYLCLNAPEYICIYVCIYIYPKVPHMYLHFLMYSNILAWVLVHSRHRHAVNCGRVCFSVLKSTQIYLSVLDYIGTNSHIHKYIWMQLYVLGYIWIYLSGLEYILMCLNVFSCNLNFLKCTQICSNVCCCTWMQLNVLECNQKCLHIIQYR